MMKCPECGDKAKVVDTRTVDDYVWRRKQCSNEHRFTTREYMWPSGHMDQDTEQFVLEVLKDARTRGVDESQSEHQGAERPALTVVKPNIAEELEQWVREGQVEDNHLPQGQAQNVSRTWPR